VTERFGLGVGNCRPVGEVVASVEEAERRGAEVAFIAEDINCRNAFEIAAVAATRTERIRLATGVVNPYTRNPTSLAMAIATLDEISDGRSILGIGTSSPSLIEDQMGLIGGRSVQVMHETTDVVRALLSGEAVTFAGEYHRYREARLEVPTIQPHIPIFFAAMGPRMLRLAGRIADGVLLNVGASIEYVRWAVGEIHDGALAASRDPSEITIAAWMSVYVGDREQVLPRARAWLAGMLSIPRQGELLLEKTGLDTDILTGIRAHYRAYPHQGDPVRAAEYVPDEVAERLALVGPPGRIQERIGEYRAAGVQVPVVGPSALAMLLP